jgi:mannose-6-phosphate isomerase-like protein (cupin superfamily)
MKAKWYLAIVAVATSASFALSGRGAEPEATAAPEATANAPEFKNLSGLKWDKILPDLGADSPEISILHVDPKTHATSLLIRTPTAIHVRKHWHTANETHTLVRGTATFACDGKKFDLNPGGFNFMPAKMVHEAWLPANSLTFITVDGAWDLNWVEGPPTAADLMK